MKQRELQIILLSAVFFWAGVVLASCHENLYPTAVKSVICKAQAPQVAFANKCPNKIKQFIVSKCQGENCILSALQVSVNQGEKKFVSRPVPAITNKSPPSVC